jgi:hypothetical protein
MRKPGDIITIESEDGVLHEMILKSINQDNRTVTGEVAFWKNSKGKIVKTVTVPDHSIREDQ